jgi:hypothetical protein
LGAVHDDAPGANEDGRWLGTSGSAGAAVVRDGRTVPTVDALIEMPALGGATARDGSQHGEVLPETKRIDRLSDLRRSSLTWTARENCVLTVCRRGHPVEQIDIEALAEAR